VDGDMVPMPYDQQFQIQIAAVDDTGAIGENLTNHIIRLVQSDEEEEYLKAVAYYATIMGRNSLTKLNGMDTDTLNYLEATYESAQRQGGKPEAYKQAAKEQQAIHIRKSQGADSVSIADSEFRDYGSSFLTDGLGDVLETRGIDIPGMINDSEFKFSGTFQTAYLKSAKNIARYMQSTEGRIEWGSVRDRAIQRTLAYTSPNFLNAGVPSGGQQYMTTSGLEGGIFIEPQLTVNALDGADTPEDAAHLRGLARTDLSGKKVSYLGESYTLVEEYSPKGMPSYVSGSSPTVKEILIDDIEMFTGAQPRYDKYGALTADLRYKNYLIYDGETGKTIETWNGHREEDYIVPEGMTDISGGTTRADINPRIGNQ